MPKHTNPDPRTVYDLTINGGQGGAGGEGEIAGATGGAGGTGTDPTMNPKIRTKSFVVGRVTNYNAAPSAPTDFRMIPLGDIDLQREIRVKEYTSFLTHQRRARVRRIYSAKVAGQDSSVMVAMYQGNGAGKEWRQDINKYMSFRHPNIVQVYSVASSNGIHATIFHDDLIPLKQFLRQHSPLLAVYICIYCVRDFEAASEYFFETLEKISKSECMHWIRRSTGRLSVELALCDDSLWLDDYHVPPLGRDWPAKHALGAPEVQMVVNSVSIEQYHFICDSYLRRNLTIFISASTPVNLRAVFCSSSNQLREDVVEIGSLPNAVE